MEDLITLNFQPHEESIVSTRITLSSLKWFSSLMERYPDQAEFFVDRDRESVHYVLDIVSTPNFTSYPSHVIGDLEYFKNGAKEVGTLVTLSLRGTLYKTYLETLKGSEILSARLSDRWGGKEEVIFLDRSPRIFQHVLSYLRNSQYPFPKEFRFELEFFCIDFVEEKPIINDFKSPEDIISLHAGSIITLAESTESFPVTQASFIRSLKPFSGDVMFGRTFHFSIPQDGDLVKQMYLVFSFPEGTPSAFQRIQDAVFHMVEFVELRIGARTIDTLDQKQLYILCKWLKKKDYRLLVERFGNRHMILPLYFSFNCGTNDAALKMLSIMIHAVEIYVKLTPLIDGVSDYTKIDCKLYMNVVNLSSDVRRRIRSTEIIDIPFVQHFQKFEQEITGDTHTISIRPKLYIFKIILVIQRHGDSPFDFGEEPLMSGVLRIDSHAIRQFSPLLCALDRRHFGLSEPEACIYTLNFDLPGINMSRIEQLTLDLKTRNVDKGSVTIWCLNLNKLRYVSKMAVLRYWV